MRFANYSQTRHYGSYLAGLRARGAECLEVREAELSGKVIAAAIEVHRELGPGLLESCYQSCLAYELRCRRIRYVQRMPLPVVYRGVKLDVGYALDFLVEDELVLEIKSVEALHPIHEAQLLTYMKLGGYRLGLLINFNVLLLKNGIKRMIL